MLDRDGDGEVSLAEFMALVKAPMKKAVHAVIATTSGPVELREGAGNADRWPECIPELGATPLPRKEQPHPPFSDAGQQVTIAIKV